MMSMGIMVEDFKYIRGVNDSEYIELLKNAYERQKRITSKAIAKLKEQEPEIIRCKECKLNKTSCCAMAFHELNWNDDDDFCSWGEKGEPNETD